MNIIYEYLPGPDTTNVGIHYTMYFFDKETLKRMLT